MRRALLHVAALLTAVTAPAALGAQAPDGAVRFEIQAVDDSTFTFAVGPRDWVKPRQRGIAVDPRRRDVLVARFVVWRVDRDTATALITGETTRLSPEHMVLLHPPPPRWFRTSLFWIGAAIGAAAGALSALALD